MPAPWEQSPPLCPLCTSQLLLYPNPTDPLNGEAAALMMRDADGYARYEGEWRDGKRCGAKQGRTESGEAVHGDIPLDNIIRNVF